MNSIQQHQIQARANQMLDAWLLQTTAADSTTGTTVSKREAQQLVRQAEKLPAAEVEQLKTAFLQKIQKDQFSVAPDARQLFLDFFKIPAESIPVSSTKRSSVTNAQQTRVKNETDQRTRVATRDVKEMIRNTDGMPENLRVLVANSLLGQMQSGNIKLDQDGRAALTKFIAQNGGGKEGNFGLSMQDGAKIAGTLREAQGVLGNAMKNNMINMGRGMLVDVVNHVEGNGGLSALDRSLSMGVQPMSYAAYVAANGGSFEDILFAFLMQLADKVDKKLMEKIKEMDAKERREKTQMKAGQDTQDALNKALAGLGDAAPTTPGAQMPPAGSPLKKVSTQLEAVVQSAHHATANKSDGGVQITKQEAERLVTKLESLPPNVQTLLAGSVSAAMRAKGLPLQPEAFDALVTWGKKATGGKFDVGDAARSGAAAMPPAPDTALAQALSKSDKLEDKLASFLVDTLVDPSKDLKAKFEPFKAMRQEIDSFAQNQGPQAEGPSLAEAGEARTSKSKKKAPKNAPVSAEAAVSKPELPKFDIPGLDGTAPTQAAAEPAQSDAMAQNELQRLMQERNRIFDMLSNMMKAMQDMIMTSVRNMR